MQHTNFSDFTSAPRSIKVRNCDLSNQRSERKSLKRKLVSIPQKRHSIKTCTCYLIPYLGTLTLLKETAVFKAKKFYIHLFIFQTVKMAVFSFKVLAKSKVSQVVPNPAF